jgi:hypothetical protein
VPPVWVAAAVALLPVALTLVMVALPPAPPVPPAP